MNWKEFICAHRWWFLLGLFWGIFSLAGMDAVAYSYRGIISFGDHVTISKLLFFLPLYISLKISFMNEILGLILAIPIGIFLSCLLSNVFNFTNKIGIKSISWSNLEPRKRGAILGFAWGLFILLFSLFDVDVDVQSRLILFLFPWYILFGYFVMLFSPVIWAVYGYLIGTICRSKTWEHKKVSDF